MSRRRRRILGAFGGAPRATIHNIASNTRGPGIGSGASSNGINTTCNTREDKFNESGVALSNIALIYSGWKTDTVNEVDLPNDYTISASIEYPAATYTQVTWGGAATKLIGAGLNVTSDFIEIAIPADAQFWIRSHVEVAAGEVWATSGPVDAARGEAAEQGVGLADKTMSGTISGTVQGIRASGVVSNVPTMTKISLGVIGDSINYGSGDGLYDSHSNTSWIGRAATGNCPILNCAVVGTQLKDQVLAANVSRRLDLFTKCGITHVVSDYGVNDTGTRTLTQVQNDLTALAGLVVAAGFRFIQSTITPKTTSIDKWFTSAGQTPAAGFTGGAASVRSQFNAWLRTLPAAMYAYIENADLLETVRDSCIWKSGDSGTPYLYPNTDVWTVGVGSTTTVFTSNSNKAADYYRFGSVMFLTGALAGTFVNSVTGQTSGGTFTVPALASAPSSGDTFAAYPIGASATTDGLHPDVDSLTKGGHIILKEGFVPIIQEWNGLGLSSIFKDDGSSYLYKDDGTSELYKE